GGIEQRGIVESENRAGTGRQNRASRNDGNCRGESRADLQIRDAVLRFRVGAVVFVPQTEIQGKICGKAPIVLNEKVERIRPKVVGSRAGLQRGLLREAEEEIGEVVARVGKRLRAACRIAGCCESREDKAAFRVTRRPKTL